MKVINFLFNNPQPYYKPEDFLDKLKIRKEQWEQVFNYNLKQCGIISKLSERPKGEKGHTKRFFMFNKNRFLSLAFDYFLRDLHKENGKTIIKLHRLKKRHEEIAEDLNEKFYFDIDNKRKKDTKDYTMWQYILSESGAFSILYEIGCSLAINTSYILGGNYPDTNKPVKKYKINGQKTIRNEDIKFQIEFIYKCIEGSITLPENLNHDNMNLLYQYFVNTQEYIFSKEEINNFKELSKITFDYWVRNTKSLVKKNQLLFSVNGVMPSMTAFCYTNELIERGLHESHKTDLF